MNIYYLPITGHFIAGTEWEDKVIYFDWTGEIYPTEEVYSLSDIRENDPLWYNRLLRDCFY